MVDGRKHIKEEKPAPEKDANTLTDLDEEERVALDRVRALEQSKKILELNRQEKELREEMPHLTRDVQGGRDWPTTLCITIHYNKYPGT